ncbi:glycosyltransferase family 2 protein [Treponema sp. C6A8]|uniref:glycosyltransferase family 2 protein n=1 Tax=Treponema sp. C6A8 TaxID=1410609 RepID=UPI000686B226|nr:glycosyltransferase family 2 protein [Treponema sp. C6A8]
MKRLENPKISVAIVVYNRVKTLGATLQSIANQNYNNIEVIVIDGGSTDGTTDIIKKYESLITYSVSEHDNGIYDAMNKALEKATGDWLLFLGSDDKFYNKNVLNSIVPKFKKNAVNLGMVEKSDDLNIEGGFPLAKYRVSFSNPCQQALFYPKVAYTKFRFNLKYKIFGDWDFNIRMFCKYPVHFFKDVVSVYCTEGISSCSKDSVFINDREKIIRDNYSKIQMMIYFIMKYRRVIQDKFQRKTSYKGVLYE